MHGLCIETYRMCFKMGENSSTVLVPGISLAIRLTDHRHFSLARHFAYLIIHQSWNFLPSWVCPQPNLAATACAVSKGNFAPHFASAFWCFLLWAKNMNSLVHTEMGNVLWGNYTENWWQRQPYVELIVNTLLIASYMTSPQIELLRFSSTVVVRLFFFPLFCFDLLLI